MDKAESRKARGFGLSYSCGNHFKNFPLFGVGREDLPEISGLGRRGGVEIMAAQNGFRVSTFERGTLHGTLGTYEKREKGVPKDIVPKGEFGADVLHQPVGVGWEDFATEARQPLMEGRADRGLPVLVSFRDFGLDVDNPSGEVDQLRAVAMAGELHEFAIRAGAETAEESEREISGKRTPLEIGDIVHEVSALRDREDFGNPPAKFEFGNGGCRVRGTPAAARIGAPREECVKIGAGVVPSLPRGRAGAVF